MILKNSNWIVLFIALQLACNKTNKSNRTNVFHYNQPNYISTLDPAFAKTQNNIWVVDHLYNQLININDSLQLTPEIAQSWTISNDGLLYSFKIRNDVYFHPNICFGEKETRRVVSKDIVYSFNRLLDPNVNSPGSWIFSDKLDSTESFKALNDSIFQIRLHSPFSPLLKLLTMQYCSIVPKEAVAYYGKDFYKNPVGTGPFQLKKWLDRKGIFLSKNTNYYDHLIPSLDGIRISFIEDRNTAYLEFLKKQIDFFSGIQSSFALQILNKEGNLREDINSDIQLLKGDYLNSEYIGINLSLVPENHPLHNKFVRQALNYAIDRHTLIQLLKYGIGTPANCGFIPKGLPSYDTAVVKGYTFNPQKARDLLKSAGFESMENFPELTIHTNKDYIDVITMVAKQWEEIGIPVKIELVETASLREKMRQSEIMIFRASWIADYPDEESFLNVFYSKNPAPPNYTRFDNSNFDKQYELAIKETNEQKRKLLYQNMDRIIIDEFPVIFLFYDQTAWFVQSHVLNLKTNPINLLKLEAVRDTL